MDGHALIGDIAMFSCMVGDGGPRGYRRRRSPLPEHYLPGRFLARLSLENREAITRAVNSAVDLAPWFLRVVVDEDERRALVPPEPVDRRWSTRGRWATPRCSR
jgi:hypothetical protein